MPFRKPIEGEGDAPVAAAAPRHPGQPQDSEQQQRQQAVATDSQEEGGGAGGSVDERGRASGSEGGGASEQRGQAEEVARFGSPAEEENAATKCCSHCGATRTSCWRRHPQSGG